MFNPGVRETNVPRIFPDKPPGSSAINDKISCARGLLCIRGLFMVNEIDVSRLKR